MLQPRYLLVPISFLAGCARSGAPPVPPPVVASPTSPALPSCAPRPSPAADAPLSPEDRRALLDGLVADVRDLHVFSPSTAKGLGLSWETDDLPVLRAEILVADTRTKLDAALRHFGNSLHDAHCGFLPTGPANGKQTLGFDVAVEWADGAARFYVDRVKDAALAGTIVEGDRVVSVDGVPERELLRSRRFDSNAPTWRGIAEEIAQSLTHHRAPIPSPSRWELADRASGKVRAIDLSWKPPPSDALDDDTDHDVDFTRGDCDGLPDRRYGPYRITARGFDYCLYTSTDPQHRGYPIVRHFTFHYDGARPNLQHLVRGEHDNLRDQLRALGAVRGVVVDLRDNRGGNNANMVLDWYAPPRPYSGDFLFPRLHPAFASREAAADLVNLDGAMVEGYLRATAGYTKGSDPFTLRLPDTCPALTCDWDNRHVPSHPVSAAPVALLVGPTCASSCDFVARIFSDGGFGPVVGAPTAGVNSMIQVSRRIKAPDGRPLGELRLAFSRQASGKTGLEIEGVPTPVTVGVERTFENRERYDAEIVDRAISALGRGKGK
jgi:Peptidase family S41